MKRDLILLLIILGLGNACSNTVEEDNALIGEWKAQWKASEELANTTTSSVPIKTEMDGMMIFDPGNKLRIEGYGYPGCIFSEDTIKNVLRWAYEENKISLYNEKDSFVMEYDIQEISEERISMLFLGDIRIELIKVK